MQNQKVNITSFQKNLHELMNLVMNGDEIIITKSNIPIAKITPIDNTSVTFKNRFLSSGPFETKGHSLGEAPENWFG